jgi:uncharacterized integral membrane protein
MAGAPTTGKAASGTGGKRAGVAVSPRTIVAGLIIVAAVWFIVVNRQHVQIQLWVPKVTAPLWLVLVLTFAAGMLTEILLRRGRDKKRG